MAALPQRLTFVDVETTGIRISDRIIEIGILKVENNRLVKKFETLINPECFVPEEILALTGISVSKLSSAPTFYQLKRDLFDLFDDSIFVAHNVRFDLSFLRNEFRRFDINFSPKHFCTVKLSRYLFPQFQRHNLDSLIERFNFKCKRRHRALDDAKVLFDFYKLIQKQFSQDQITQALNKALKKPSVPIKIAGEILENLPQSPGVYIFYGSNKAPLYIGKSVNIKDRVLSHFSSDHLSSKEMKIAQQIENIEIIQTSGELGALLKESSLVKKMQPLYNSTLRHSKQLFVLKSKTDEKGYQTVATESVSLINPGDLENIIGIFRSKKQIKNLLINFCKNFDLCEKLVGLEKTKTECFGYRLGKCKGACLGKEKSLKYNLRFTEAFYHSKIKPWPFKGAIVISEGDEGYLMDKWCYLGTLDKNGEIDKNHEYFFDLDTYKILVRYLLKPKNLKNVRNIMRNDTKARNIILVS